jgi:hypothetical protein
MSTATFLDRFFDPITHLLPPETARQLIDLQLDPNVQARIDELAAKANEGTLTDDERQEYAEYVEGLDLIAIFKLKAQAALDRQAL